MVTLTLIFTLLFKGQMLRFHSSWHNVKARIIAPQRKNCNVCLKFTKAISCRLLCGYLAVGCVKTVVKRFCLARTHTHTGQKQFRVWVLVNVHLRFSKHLFWPTFRAKQPQLLLSSYSPEHTVKVTEEPQNTPENNTDNFRRGSRRAQTGELILI